MKTLEKILNYKFKCIDGRDINRLSQFLTIEQLQKFGTVRESVLNDKKRNVLKWTKRNILKQLKDDVSFGFEKALNQRGISAGLMYEVVKFWNWVLEDRLENWDNDNYAYYGLPLFKATALKYGFDNPIGEDKGDEDQYSGECD